MDKTQAPMDVSNDVLHIPAQTKLTQEEIAKAVAHHNRHHPDQDAQRMAAANKTQNTAQGKKRK